MVTGNWGKGIFYRVDKRLTRITSGIRASDTLWMNLIITLIKYSGGNLQWVEQSSQPFGC